MMSSTSGTGKALAATTLLVFALVASPGRCLSLGHRALIRSPSSSAIEERDRLKSELENKMADYLYSVMMKNSNKGQQRGVSELLSQSMDYPLYLDASSSGESLSPSEAAAVRLLWKKSAGASANEANRPIHFHPCYFNAVSCF